MSDTHKHMNSIFVFMTTCPSIYGCLSTAITVKVRSNSKKTTNVHQSNLIALNTKTNFKFVLGHKCLYIPTRNDIIVL